GAAQIIAGGGRKARGGGVAANGRPETRPSAPVALEDSLVRVAFGPIREQGHHRLARPEAARDPESPGRGGAGGAPGEDARLAREGAASLEGLGVRDRDDLVDETLVEDRPDLREPDP